MNTNLIYTKIRVAGAAAADGQQDEERAGGRGHHRVRRRRPTRPGQVPSCLIREKNALRRTQSLLDGLKTLLDGPN